MTRQINNGDVLVIDNVREQIKAGNELVLTNKTTNTIIKVQTALSGRLVDIMLAGGLLNYTRKQNK